MAAEFGEGSAEIEGVDEAFVVEVAEVPAGSLAVDALEDPGEGRQRTSCGGAMGSGSRPELRSTCRSLAISTLAVSGPRARSRRGGALESGKLLLGRLGYFAAEIPGAARIP